jgi:hypothetical protein
VLEFAVFPKIHSIKRERLGLPCHIEIVLYVLLPHLRDSYLRTGGLFSCSLWLILHMKKWHCVHVGIVATSKVIQQHVESHGGMMSGSATVWKEAVVVCFEALCQRLSPAGIEKTQNL